MEEKFRKGDYIVNRNCHDMAIYDKVDAKGYMHFKEYYSHMFKKFKDTKAYTMQINYQKFYELCDEAERSKLDSLLVEFGKKKKKDWK